ncbi:hypothetical protein TYRP_012660 [Tyrophagus putrescentiae]|nr:hypothetical protein TYRP_012660 [Tyrophagus putrescentiae]
MSGPAAHPDVTWPLSTPSSSGLARCARETLVCTAAPATTVLLQQPKPVTARTARTAARGHSFSHQQCSCCDSNTRLRTTDKTAISAKTKDNVLNFLGFLVDHKPRPKTAAASGQSLSQHSCRDSDTRARGSQSQRRIATENVPNFLGFLTKRNAETAASAAAARSSCSLFTLITFIFIFIISILLFATKRWSAVDLRAGDSLRLGGLPRGEQADSHVELLRLQSCPDSFKCVRDSDNVSINSYVHRCKPEGAEIAASAAAAAAAAAASSSSSSFQKK